MDSTNRGVTKAEIEQRREDIFEHAARSSEERIRVQYILRRIAEAEDLGVSDDEVDRELDAMARRYNVSRERVRDALDKRDALDGVRRNLLAGKALERVLQTAVVEEVEAPAPAAAGEAAT
jgi:trigger factor